MARLETFADGVFAIAATLLILSVVGAVDETTHLKHPRAADDAYAVSIITIYTLIGLKWEEKKLEREFGEAYRMYKQQVPMIFPRFTAKANQPLSRHSL